MGDALFLRLHLVSRELLGFSLEIGEKEEQKRSG
jgi:hypothetical protein